MGTIDDVRMMQNEGKSSSEIAATLKQRGLSDAEISDVMAQAQIKSAVGGSSLSPMSGNPVPSPSDFGQQQNILANSGGQNLAQGISGGNQNLQGSTSFSQQQPLNSQQNSQGQTQQVQEQNSLQSNSSYSPQETYSGGNYSGMQPSLMDQQTTTESSENTSEGYGGASEGYGENYNYEGYGYPEYQYYNEAVSSDVITEIAEQVVSEKMEDVRKNIEELTKFKTVSDTKLSALQSRLERIEKIIDTLQISILKRVGDYMTDVKDLKKEIIETQKSFKALTKSSEEHKKQQKQK